MTLSKEGIETQSSLSRYSESILDEYRFDLLYALDKLSNEYDAIIFEDMDRLDTKKCITLFHQLREINISLNTRKIVKENHLYFISLRKQVRKVLYCLLRLKRSRKYSPFRFVYVINDEITEKINQTKFFDYVMSIVPSLGPKNAFEKFYSIILDDQNLELSAKEYSCIVNAINVSSRLRDYRTLLQIKNDYILFLYIMTSSGINMNKCKGILLCFVIYKVLWPQDYHLIRNDKSFVFPEWRVPDEKMWKERNGNDTNPHQEYEAIKCLKDIIANNSICLKFLGYSHEEQVEYFNKMLPKTSIEDRKLLISADDEFIFGTVLLNQEEANKYILNIENDFLIYLIHNYDQYSNQYDFNRFLNLLCKSEMETISKFFVEEIIQLLQTSLDRVNLFVFVTCFFLKLGYTHSDDESKNIFGWLIEIDNGLIRERLKLLNELCDEKELDIVFSGFSGQELRLLQKECVKDSLVYNRIVEAGFNNVDFES